MTRANRIDSLIARLRREDPEAYAQLVVAPFSVVPEWVRDEGPQSSWYRTDDARALERGLQEAL